MYINRTDNVGRSLDVKRKDLKRTKKQESSFADTMASIIEVDVVEVGDSTEEQKKQQYQQQPPREEPQKGDSSPKKSSLDIKV